MRLCDGRQAGIAHFSWRLEPTAAPQAASGEDSKTVFAVRLVGVKSIPGPGEITLLSTFRWENLFPGKKTENGLSAEEEDRKKLTFETAATIHSQFRGDWFGHAASAEEAG